jgi:hypothetical protein
LILKSHGVTIPVVPNRQLNAVLRERFLKLEPRDAHDGMVQFLRKTRNLLGCGSFGFLRFSGHEGSFAGARAAYKFVFLLTILSAGRRRWDEAGGGGTVSGTRLPA